MTMHWTVRLLAHMGARLTLSSGEYTGEGFAWFYSEPYGGYEKNKIREEGMISFWCDGVIEAGGDESLEIYARINTNVWRDRIRMSYSAHVASEVAGRLGGRGVADLAAYAARFAAGAA